MRALSKICRSRRLAVVILGVLAWGISASECHADGKVVRPRDYKGSLEEKAQEAIIIFEGSEEEGKASADLILKIRVEGQTDEFAWVIPFPNTPKVEREEAQVFKELFDYVQARRIHTRSKGPASGQDTAATAKEKKSPDVEVLSREIVGSYDVAVVKEHTDGKLNGWLEENGYQPLQDAEDVLTFYRDKGYCYACIKVSDAALGQSQGQEMDLHPLRFTFQTGGQDGIYFPMKLTGLQSEPFDVNLYVFYKAWLNDDLNQFGYTHRGFSLYHRDWDTPECVPNGGKAYSHPESDPYLKGYASRLMHTMKLMQKLHPGQKYYLTNLQAYGLKPADVREWKDDLWMFPYYTNEDFVPYDARPGKPGSGAWIVTVTEDGEDADAVKTFGLSREVWWVTGGIVGGLVIGFLAAWFLFRRQPGV